MELFKSGERLKSCRVKLPLKESLASWRKPHEAQYRKAQSLALGAQYSQYSHLCSLVAAEPWGYPERLEYTLEQNKNFHVSVSAQFNSVFYLQELQWLSEFEHA